MTGRFTERPTRHAGTTITRGWRLKRYEISVDGHMIDPSVISAADSTLDENLPDAAGDVQVGFAIVHYGAEQIWILADLWNGDIISQHTFYADFETPTVFTPVATGGPTACVWELAIHAHERDAFIRHVLNPISGPDLDAYLADTITSPPPSNSDLDGPTTIEPLSGTDFSARHEPDPKLEPREFFEAWLRYQRHEFIRKLRDLEPEQLVAWSIPPVQLSVLGLVRHMAQMENYYLLWGLGGGEHAYRYGEVDYAGGSVATVDEDLRWYFDVVERAEAAVAAMPSLEAEGMGHGRSLQATLVKMVDEYALHAGQAHMLRFAAIGEMTR